MEATTNNFDDTAADEILVAFAQAGPDADAADWMRRHPAQAGAIARHAADHWAGEPVATADDAAAAERLRRLGRETVRACRLRSASAAATLTPTAAAAGLSGLLSAAKARGLDAAALAAQVRVPPAVLAKLHRRLIEPATVPAALVRSLADALGRTADEIAAYLRQPPTLAAGASYRADDTPTVGGRQSFADALAADPEITDEVRAHWEASAE